MTSILPFLTVLIVGNVVTVLTFLVVWIRNFRETLEFLPIGLVFASVVLVVDVIIVSLIGLESVGMSAAWLYLMDALAAIRVYAFTVVGLLLARRLNESRAATADFPHGKAASVPYGVSVPSKEAILFALLSVGFLVVYSAGLFELTDVKLGAAFLGQQDLMLAVTPLGLLAVGIIGFSEEIVFRLGIQNGLTYLWRSSRSGPHWAIIVSTSFWCLGHLGVMDPDWVKIAQIFVFGLILGYLNRRFGIIPCMITHSLFNVIMAALTPSLFGDMLLVPQMP